MKPITIRDLAEAAGTSIATVSRALSGAPKVGRETRSRIIHLAELLGYRSGNHRKTIGVVLPSLEMPRFDAYTATFQKALTLEIYRRGYRTIILSFEDIELLNESMRPASPMVRRNFLEWEFTKKMNAVGRSS